MKKSLKVFSIASALALSTCGQLAAPAFAKDMSGNAQYNAAISLSSLPDSSVMEQEYIDSIFNNSGISLYSSYGRPELTDAQQYVYDALKAETDKIAAGTRSSTEVTVPLTTSISSEAELEELSKAITYLTEDMPEKFYWISKKDGVDINYNGNGSTQALTVKLPVSANYAGSADYTVDTAKIQAAQASVNKAQTIAAKYDGKPDHEKVKGYKEEICALVSYNDDAAKPDFNSSNGDPWQMVWVFDEDPSTNVVCEGYAKAFQYLCDLGGVDCFTVTGNMARIGDTGEGHMWNIVVLDGKSYLVDVTNCDGQSIGAPEYLLLKGADADSSSGNGCTFTINELNGVIYTYDADTKAKYAAGLLTVSEADYVYTAPAKLPAAKSAVEKALNALAVSNDTTEAAVKDIVNKAITDPAVTAVTTVSVKKATEEAAGSVTVNVTLKCDGETDVILDTFVRTIAKLPAQDGDGDDNNGSGSDDNSGSGSDDKVHEIDPAVTAKVNEAKGTIEDELDGADINVTQSGFTMAHAQAIANIAGNLLGDDSGFDITVNSFGNAGDEEVHVVLKIVYNDRDWQEGYATVRVKVQPDEAEKPVTPAPAPVVYSVSLSGDYIGSGVTVTGAKTAGSVMTLNVPVGYEAAVVSGGNVIARVSDGTGTFIMPAGNVSVKVSGYLGAYTIGYANAYIYSYDKDMNHIKTNSARGGMTAREGVVTAKLGSEYAGRSVTLYTGRKSTANKVDEAVLDSNGNASFNVESGRNYTLMVED